MIGIILFAAAAAATCNAAFIPITPTGCPTYFRTGSTGISYLPSTDSVDYDHLLRALCPEVVADSVGDFTIGLINGFQQVPANRYDVNDFYAASCPAFRGKNRFFLPRREIIYVPVRGCATGCDSGRNRGDARRDCGEYDDGDARRDLTGYDDCRNGGDARRDSRDYNDCRNGEDVRRDVRGYDDFDCSYQQGEFNDRGYDQDGCRDYERKNPRRNNRECKECESGDCDCSKCKNSSRSGSITGRNNRSGNQRTTQCSSPKCMN